MATEVGGVVLRSGRRGEEVDGRARAARDVPRPAGQPVVTFKSAFQVGAAPVHAVSAPKPDGSVRELDGIPAGVGTSMGDAAAGRSRWQGDPALQRRGQAPRPFAPVNTERLAINGLDDVAALVREDKSIVIFDRTGATW